MNPAIVISAYNRPQALERLLRDLDRADYTEIPVPLVISIDRAEEQARKGVIQVAQKFQWGHGPKRIICHDDHLGLVAQVMFCGNLAEEYGAVVFLEDDLGVSPVFYKYARAALAFYDEDPKVAGISLYALWFNGYTRQPFVPLADGSDVFFIQVPYTQGQGWTKAQWKRWASWRAAGEHTLLRQDLHELFLHFDAEDWFPLMAQYVISTGQYYVYPRVSLATGMGDPGTHFSSSTSFLQAPLLQAKETFAFRNLDDSAAVYDSFFEILPDRLNRLGSALRGYDYDVDLYATKRPHHLHSPYVLTSRPGREPERTFGRTMWPHETNVIREVPGEQFLLCRVEHARWDWLAELEARKANHDYFTRGQRVGLRTSLLYAGLTRIHRR